MADQEGTVEDTGTLAAVPEDEQLDQDGGPGSDASEGGADDDLEDVYADPGALVLPGQPDDDEVGS